MPAEKFRNVCFTINNPGADLDFDDEKMQYLIYQEEMGVEVNGVPGTHHFQGYLELKEQTTFLQVKAIIGDRAHIERRRGTQKQAIDYCRKEGREQGGRIEGTEVREHGSRKEQGSRNDVKDFVKAVVVDKKRKREMFEEHALEMAKFPRLYTELKSLWVPERQPLKVFLLIGPPGCGKTRSVYEAYKGDMAHDLWRTPLMTGSSQWYDGYDHHPAALLDDFDGDMKLKTLLQLIDRYPVMAPVKCSFAWWTPEVIFITTNIYPRDWYDWTKRGVQYGALARRFTAVFDFYEMEDGGDPPVGANDLLPYMHDDYITHGISLRGCMCPPRYEGQEWWIREKPETVTTPLW